jgi:hypothetical protein
VRRDGCSDHVDDSVPHADAAQDTHGCQYVFVLHQQHKKTRARSTARTEEWHRRDFLIDGVSPSEIAMTTIILETEVLYAVCCVTNYSQRDWKCISYYCLELENISGSVKVLKLNRK